MSIQLIVFPQTALTNEFVVDGTNFNTINFSDSYDSSASNATLDTLTNAAPTVLNAWYRFRSTSAGTPTLPTEVTGSLTLYSTTTSTLSGVYQRLSNLVVGTTYEIVVDLSTTGSGFVVTSAYNGTTVILNSVQAANQSQITFTWNAASSNDTIIISYFNSVADDIIISNISVSPQGVAPTNTYTNLQDGQVICDLYEDEDIPLSLSVDDFKNVAEKVQSYSKAFNLPATKRNNQIFDNIFEITRTDTGLNFNPYKRTKAILKQDGFLLFEGYLRMIDISDKSGEISYNVNLYSEVVALADVLGDKTFLDLDLTELEHGYNKLQIQYSWNDTGTSMTFTNPNTSGFRDDYTTLRYPFVDWTHQILVGGSSGSAATDGFPELTKLETAFRPFINIKYLIDRIFQDVPFTYESAFFNTDDFKKLYMDFNWGGDTLPSPSNIFWGTWKKSALVPSNNNAGAYKELQLIPESSAGGLAGSTLPPNYNTSTYIITATSDNEIYDISYRFNIENTNGTSSNLVDCRWLHTIGGVVQPDINFQQVNLGSNFHYYIGDLQIALNTGDTLACQWKGVNSRQLESAFNLSNAVFVVSSSTVTTESLLALRGDIGQMDFIKGLMTMFNLVTLPDEDNPNNIKIEPYTDVFIPTATAGNTLANRGITHDWTEKIDVTEIKLMPLIDLNKNTIFKFVEDEEDYAFMNYKTATNHLYGSKKFKAGNEFNILAGEKEIIAEPFAATVVKPLMSQFSDFVTPAVYSYNPEEETSEGFDNSPRIMYNNGIKSDADGTFVSCTYYIPEQNGGTSSQADAFLQFSHLTSVPTITTDRDFHFGECQLLLSVGNPVNNNLFNLYWLPYYAELYNPDTRIMTIKVNLSPSDINTFKFNDKVFIKNRIFRVNKIDYKPNDLATVEFILIP